MRLGIIISRSRYISILLQQFLEHINSVILAAHIYEATVLPAHDVDGSRLDAGRSLVREE